VFELELAPKGKGPPVHTHDEGDETIEVLEGEITFRVRGQDRTLRAGESLTLTPADPHTFWNPSKTSPVRCKVTHGSRFERAIVQPTFPALVVYLALVDPGASRTQNGLVASVMKVIAILARAIGVRPVLA
jgi:uncharacterized cupin superfamily protein